MLSATMKIIRTYFLKLYSNLFVLFSHITQKCYIETNECSFAHGPF